MRTIINRNITKLRSKIYELESFEGDYESTIELNRKVKDLKDQLYEWLLAEKRLTSLFEDLDKAIDTLQKKTKDD